jgi:acetylornithine deacetylase
MLPTNVIAMTQALVRISSVNPYYDPASPGEGAAGEWIRAWAVENGFDVSSHEVFPGRSNIVIRLRNGADHPNVLLNGHIDTVGVQGMTIAPFSGEIKDGRVCGRGSADMKGQDACMLVAALKLKNDLKSWRGTLTAGFSVDEEYRFSGIKKLMETIPAPDYAIVGEPTSMRVVRGSKGCLRFVLRAKGRACHSSTPWQGKSAIVAVSEAVLLLDAFFSQKLAAIELPEFGKSTGSVGIIEGGSGVNIVPESCAVQVDVRLIPGQDWQDTYAQIQRCVKDHARRVPGIEWSFSDPTVLCPPFETPATDALVELACKVLKCGAPQVVQYSCDASNIFSAKTATVVVGPGQIEQAHTATESMSVVELEQAVGQYVELAQALMPPQ